MSKSKWRSDVIIRPQGKLKIREKPKKHKTESFIDKKEVKGKHIRVLISSLHIHFRSSSTDLHRYRIISTENEFI